jgi:hypothetical protein
MLRLFIASLCEDGAQQPKRTSNIEEIAKIDEGKTGGCFEGFRKLWLGPVSCE